MDWELENQNLQAENTQLHTQLAEAEAKVEKMRKALEEIAEGKGRFSTDRLTHASNTIEDMKALAADALDEHAEDEVDR